MQMRKVVIKCGTETPDQIMGIEYPIPDCLAESPGLKIPYTGS